MLLPSFLPIILLSSSALAKSSNRQSDKQTLAHYEKTGQCFMYKHGGPDSKVKGPCEKWCPKYENKPAIGVCHFPRIAHFLSEPLLISNYALLQCSIPGTPEQLKGYPTYKDDDGNVWSPGRCMCEDPQDFLPLIEPVLEGLSKLDNIICAVSVESFKTIAEIGVDAIPGGAEVNAAVKGAKTFTENALDAASYFDNWVGKVCGVPDWNFDITQAFGNLSDAPDAMGESQGCFQKNKKGCKKGKGKDKGKGKGNDKGKNQDKNKGKDQGKNKNHNQNKNNQNNNQNKNNNQNNNNQNNNHNHQNDKNQNKNHQDNNNHQNKGNNDQNGQDKNHQNNSNNNNKQHNNQNNKNQNNKRDDIPGHKSGSGPRKTPTSWKA